MKISTPPTRRRFLGQGARWLVTGAALPLAAPALAALPGARSLSFAHTHTSEHIALTYALDEDFVTPALSSLNHFLRDHYSGEVGQIDPQLFHLLHHVRRELGVQTPFQVISGYRSPKTNETLRTTRGGGVAKRSLHMDGKAIDIRLVGVDTARVRDAALALGAGGVGYYPDSDFLHIDTGPVRSWGPKSA